MTKQALPAVSVLTSESFEEFKTSDKVVVVACFDADDKPSNMTFSEVAESLRDDYLFGASNDAKLCKAEGVKLPGVVLYKDFDEGKDIYDGKFDKDDITKFTKSAAIPLVGEVGPETYAGYMAVSSPLALAFSDLPVANNALSRPSSPSPTSFPKPLRSAQNSQKPLSPSRKSTREPSTSQQ